MSEIFLPGLTDPQASTTVRRHGHTPEAAAAQAEAVFDQLAERLGGKLGDTCKITMHITDRAFRQAVYGVLGRRLAQVWPVSTGLIVPGLHDPDALFQLDAYAVSGGPHQRFRRYRSTDIAYGREVQAFAMDFAMTVLAGKRVFLRGQTGMTLGRDLIGLNDAGAQATQAIENVRTLLADAGATLADATRLVIYVTDRAYFPAVRAAVLPHLPPVATTEFVVKGLAAPELLMEIDVHAVLP